MLEEKHWAITQLFSMNFERKTQKYYRQKWKRIEQLFHTFVPNVNAKRPNKYLIFSSQVKKKALGGFTPKMWKKIFKKKEKIANGHLTFLSPMRKIKYQVDGWYIPPNVEEKTLCSCLMYSSLCGKQSINWLFDIFLPNVCFFTFIIDLIISMKIFSYWLFSFLVILTLNRHLMLFSSTWKKKSS